MIPWDLAKFFDPLDIEWLYEQLSQQGYPAWKTAIPLIVHAAPRCMKVVGAAGQVIDRINSRYGKHRIFLGTGLALGGIELNERDQPCWRKLNLLDGETRRRRIRIPRLDLKI